MRNRARRAGSSAGREFVVLSTILPTSGTMRVSAYTVSAIGDLSLYDQFDADETFDAAVTSLSSTRSALQDLLVGTRLTAGGAKLWSFNVSSGGELRRVGAADMFAVSTLVVGARPDSEDLVTAVVGSGSVGVTHQLTNYISLH